MSRWTMARGSPKPSSTSAALGTVASPSSPGLTFWRRRARAAANRRDRIQRSHGDRRHARYPPTGTARARGHFGGGIRRHPDGGVYRAATDHREVAQDGGGAPGLRRAAAIDPDSRSWGGIPHGYGAGGPLLDGQGASASGSLRPEEC